MKQEPCSKLKRMEVDKFVTYTCHEVQSLQEKWKEEMRKSLGVRIGKRDRYYDEYCESLDKFLEKCTCRKVDEQLDKDK